MEDLGVASGSFGRLISQMMSKPSLQKSDLQMLLEHPTVRSTAALLSLQTAESDSEGEDIPEELNTFQDLPGKSSKRPEFRILSWRSQRAWLS